MEGAREALVLAGEPLTHDEQAEALIKGEAGEIGGVLLIGPGLGHRREFERLELLNRGRGEHPVSFRDHW